MFSSVEFSVRANAKQHADNNLRRSDDILVFDLLAK
jgi:hypothetical protein